MAKVKENDQVQVHYTGTLNSGEVFDSSRDREPLEFTIGAGQMIPGFENAVREMELHEVKKVTIPSSEAYGDVEENMIQKIDKSQLPESIKPEVGQQLVSNLPNGQQMVVKVTEVEENSITIDANHPLAGQDLTFEIELVNIK